MTEAMTCDNIEDLLPEILDGTLDSELLDQAVDHIAKCEACTFAKSEIESMQSLYSRHGALRLSDEARLRIRARLTS